jgi:hypothetical protein
MLHILENTLLDEANSSIIPLSSTLEDEATLHEATPFTDGDNLIHDPNKTQIGGRLELPEQPSQVKDVSDRIDALLPQESTSTSTPTTPPLTYSETPATSPQSPPTPRNKPMLKLATRHTPMYPLLGLSKDPLLSSFSPHKPIRRSTWANDTTFNNLHSVSIQGSPVPESHSRPAPVSLFKILNEKREPRPSAAEFQSPSTLMPSESCLFQSPNPLESRNFRATTLNGRPAWWCRFDNLVTFDGMSVDALVGEDRPITRSSKGLAAANKYGQLLVVSLNIACAHCREVLGLKAWKYGTKVCQRRVCTACRAMCTQEWAKEKSNLETSKFDGET